MLSAKVAIFGSAISRKTPFAYHGLVILILECELDCNGKIFYINVICIVGDVTKKILTVSVVQGIAIAILTMPSSPKIF